MKEEEKVETQNDNVISKMFTYEEADVLVILDKEKIEWDKEKTIIQ